MKNAEKLKSQVQEMFDLEYLDKALEMPITFYERDGELMSPTELAETAQYVAGMREFVAEMWNEVKYRLALVQAVVIEMEENVELKLSEKLSENAPVLINRGFAAQERMAHAKVSLANDSVEVRAARFQKDRLLALERQLAATYQEWRNTEFAMDRLIRVTQIRMQLSEI